MQCVNWSTRQLESIFTQQDTDKSLKRKAQKSCHLKIKKSISLDQKHSSLVARIYYQKNTSRRVAVDGQISMKRLLGGSRNTSDSLIKSMLFSEKSESDISKADLKEIKNTHRIDEEEDDVESFIEGTKAVNLGMTRI